MTKLFICEKCKTVAGKICGKASLCCCGEKMKPLKFKESEELDVELNGNLIKVNFNESIKNEILKSKKLCGFVYLKTLNGGQRKEITEKLESRFLVVEDMPVSVYAYILNVGFFYNKLD